MNDTSPKLSLSVKNTASGMDSVINWKLVLLPVSLAWQTGFTFSLFHCSIEQLIAFCTAGFLAHQAGYTLIACFTLAGFTL